jgi:hypothetical protein
MVVKLASRKTTKALTKKTPIKQGTMTKEVASGKGKTQQASPTAQIKRKAEGKQAADLTQPAAGSVGRGAEQADAGLPAFKVAAKKANVFDKDLAEAQELVKKYTKQLKELKQPTGKDRFKGSKAYEKRMEKIQTIETLLLQAKDKVRDKKSRGGPGGRSKVRKFQRDRIEKKEGGKIVKASKGSQGKLIGKQKKLDVNKDGKITGSDFEMLKGNRKKYGGKISYRMTGGQVVDSSYD